MEDPVSLEGGQSSDNADKFYSPSVWEHGYDWFSEHNDQLWNSGTEDNPVKTDYDPCPRGWRVPTHAELEELCQHHSEWTTNADGQVGYWFSGANAYNTEVPQIFFPAAGLRDRSDADARSRGRYGGYWSSRPNDYYHGYYVYYCAYYLGFDSGSTGMGDYGYRENGISVRCVQQ